MISLKSFIDGSNYSEDHVFAPGELNLITATNVRNWMELKAYGTINPGSNNQPTHCRSNTLEFMKKSILHFMPHRLVPWDDVRQEGNPTKSIEVNNLIKAVKKAEVRKQGRDSSARRPLELEEFKMLIQMLSETSSFQTKVCYTTYALLQFTLIACVDDICHFPVSDLFDHSNYHHILACRLAWSKNVMEERSSPEQMILGAMDH